ncbi:MAG: protein kinase [Peltula sp. TS41687]|nr:MAG: protein kinase [Peltula sp. TS41687]
MGKPKTGNNNTSNKKKRQQGPSKNLKATEEVYTSNPEDTEVQAPKVADAGEITIIHPQVSTGQEKEHKPNDVTIDPSPELLPDTSGNDTGGNEETEQPGPTLSTSSTDAAADEDSSANTTAASGPSEPPCQGEASSAEVAPPSDNHPIEVGISDKTSHDIEPEATEEETTGHSQEEDHVEQQEAQDDVWELSSIEPALDSEDDSDFDQASDIAVVGSSSQGLTDDSGDALTEGADTSAVAQPTEPPQGSLTDAVVGNHDEGLDEGKLDEPPEDNPTSPVVDEEELGKPKEGTEKTAAPEEPTESPTQSQSDTLQDPGTSDGTKGSASSPEDPPSSPATSAGIVSEGSADEKVEENATSPEQVTETQDSGQPAAEEIIPATKSPKKKKPKKKKLENTHVNLRTENQNDNCKPKEGTSEPIPTAEDSNVNEAPHSSTSAEDPASKADGKDGDTCTKSTENPNPEDRDNEDSGSPASGVEEAEKGTAGINEEQVCHTEAGPVVAASEEQGVLQKAGAPVVAEGEAKEEQTTEAGNAEATQAPPMEGDVSQETSPDEPGSTEASAEQATPEDVASGAEEGSAEKDAGDSTPANDANSPDEAGSAGKDAQAEVAPAFEEAAGTEDAPPPADEGASAGDVFTVNDTAEAEGAASAKDAAPPAEEPVSTEESTPPDETSPGDGNGPTEDAPHGGQTAPAEEGASTDDPGSLEDANPVDGAAPREEEVSKEDAPAAEEDAPLEENALGERNSPAEEAVSAESAPVEESPPSEESAHPAETPSTEEATQVDSVPAEPVATEEAAPVHEAPPADAGPVDEAAPPEAAATAEGEASAETAIAIPASPKSGSSGRKKRHRSSLFGLEFVRDDPRSQRKRRQSDAIIPSTKDRTIQDSPRDRQRRRRYSEANYKTVVRAGEDEKQHRRKSKTPAEGIKKAKTEPIARSVDSEPRSSKVEGNQPTEKSSRRHRVERRASVYRDPSPRPVMLRLFSNMSGRSDTRPPLFVSTSGKDSKGARPTSSRHGSSHHHRSPEEKEASKARREARRSKEPSPPEPTREARKSRREEKRPAAAAPADAPKTSSSSRFKGSSDRRGRSEQGQNVNIKNLAMSGLKKLFVY